MEAAIAGLASGALQRAVYREVANVAGKPLVDCVRRLDGVKVSPGCMGRGGITRAKTRAHSTRSRARAHANSTRNVHKHTHARMRTHERARSPTQPYNTKTH